MVDSTNTADAIIQSESIPPEGVFIHRAANKEETRPPICRKNEETESSEARISEGMVLFKSVCSATEPIPSKR